MTVLNSNVPCCINSAVALPEAKLLLSLEVSTNQLRKQRESIGWEMIQGEQNKVMEDMNVLLITCRSDF